MSNSILLSQLSSLSPEQQKEVAEFIAFLQFKQLVEKKGKVRRFGSGKGAFQMAPDFDAPLDDFSEYK